jgi:DNA-binding transcriptional MocR family regulator
VASGNPDPSLLPRLGPALARLDPSPILYGAEIHDAELIQLARASFEADSIPVQSIAVVGGALDGVERVLREHLRPGDRVAVEDPGFSGIFDIVRSMALEMAPVAVDESGLVPDELARALDNGARAMVYTPRAHNPTGAALNARRVREIHSVLARHRDVLLVEDDHAGPVSGVAAVTLVQKDWKRWAVIRSVAKSLGPDLRVAVVAADSETISAVEGRQMLSLRWVSHLLQRVVVELWSDRATQKLLAKAAETYSSRRKALLEALSEHGIPASGRSGLNVWIPLQEETKTAQNLLSKGWLVEAGERFRLRSGTGIRVTVASLPPQEARALAADLSSYLKQGVRSPNA